MTFEEEYSAIMGRFFKENRGNVESLKELLFSIKHPSEGTILGDLTTQKFEVGDSNYRPLYINGDWIVQIKDKADKQIGELQFKDQFLIYCDDISKRVIAIEHANGIVSDINLFQILMDNY